MLQETPSRDTCIDSLAERFRQSRQRTLLLCEPLHQEDYGLQAMPDVSPPKWHLAHTSWFYETFLLKAFDRNYRPFHPEFEYLFNSYYQGVGPQFLRANRGLLSRPTLQEVLAYRRSVDKKMLALLSSSSDVDRINQLVELGINHEQQHQELLLTDIKYNFSHNPLYPAYRTLEQDQKKGSPARAHGSSSLTLEMIPFDGGEFCIGFSGEGFHFDNETPAHKTLLNDFQLSNRLITNGEFLEFVEDGGYTNPLLWLSDGWAHRTQENWQHPIYWIKRDGEWLEFTLNGLLPLQRSAPASHISFYEADAFARWANKRLPTEFEWEMAARTSGVPQGHLLEQSMELQRYHPSVVCTTGATSRLHQMFGDCWEWTTSAYSPYPGYKPLPGAVGEYNGKFMCNQLVLRGGSCVTSEEHIRPSYRNFFYPKDRWQFSGIRLAE